MSNNHNDERIPVPGETIADEVLDTTVGAEAGAAAIAPAADASAEPEAPKKARKAAKEKKPKKPKKPWTKKRIIILAVIVVLALLLAYSCVAAPIIAASAARSQVSTALGVTTLSAREIITSISATGIVESADKHYVYPTTAAYSVMEVPVEVGDAVQEGDILCLLDDSSIQDQIDSSELSLTQSEKSANQQVKTARDSYNALQNTVQDGTNSTLISAQAQVTSAYNAYLSAVDSYNQYRSVEDRYYSAERALSNANNAKATADAALTAAQDAVTASPTDQIALDALTAAQTAADNALAAYTAAEADYKSASTAYSAVSGKGTSLSLAIDSAYNSYLFALQSMDAAVASVETQIESSKNQLSSTKISAETASKTKDLTLEQLEGSLSDTIVRAPASGTITAVYATVGGPGSGLMFVIEDVDDLIVKTTVKAFDVGTVKPGLPVTIKSDATGEDVYDGALTFIAPATQKTATGDTNAASEVFDAEVAVSSKNTGLRIGMSVRLNYIVDKQESVLAVPYDAVYTNASGQDCVLAALDNGKGKYVLTEMPVTLGIESDLDVAISGEGIVEGLRILNEPEGRFPGEVITLI
ncbi:MAG: HlyD family efflux transporter periplasmic adaptor subunit [Candidatus Pelethousia sp.]|nr:HlyD family efflux transporter periplasmic adaptor subunit [Candidatus Pelethousia sp.]